MLVLCLSARAHRIPRSLVSHRPRACEKSDFSSQRAFCMCVQRACCINVMDAD